MYRSMHLRIHQNQYKYYAPVTQYHNYSINYHLLTCVCLTENDAKFHPCLVFTDLIINTCGLYFANCITIQCGLLIIVGMPYMRIAKKVNQSNLYGVVWVNNINNKSVADNSKGVELNQMEWKLDAVQRINLLFKPFCEEKRQIFWHIYS